MEKGKTLLLDHSWLKFYINYMVNDMKRIIEHYEEKGIDDDLMTKIGCIDSAFNTVNSINHLIKAHGRN